MMIEQIFLIGYRATGKTTLGALLAEKLGFEFMDTDHLICERAQRTVQQIVQTDGWEMFRAYEAEALQQAAAGSRRVIATGGGAVLHASQWEHICPRALVVWLAADTGTLAQRLRAAAPGDSSRPSLTGRSIHQEIEQVLGERAALYRKYADIEIDTAQVSPAEAVDIIIAAFQKMQQRSKR